MKIPLELYRIFYFVAQTGSISAASKELFITQPAVSQSVRQLEEKLGGKLFTRTPHGVILTREGEVIYKYIEQAYNFICSAETRFAEMQHLASGNIRIGASDTICRHHLAPYLEEFHRQYPEIRIQVTNRTTRETIALLKSGKVDLGIINLPTQETGDLVVKEVLSVQDIFIAGNKYRHLGQSTHTLEELSHYPLVLLEKGSSTRAYIEGFAKQAGVPIQPEFELGSIDLLVQFARIGLGISCVVKNFVTEELEREDIFEISLEENIPPRKIGAVKLKNVPLSVAGQKFMAML